MADRTGIEWTDATWNPVRGCTRISEGCRNCYAEGVAARFSGPDQPFHGLATRTPSGPRWTGKVEIAWHLLDLPLRWRQPRRIFVNSMSDLFHEAMDQEEIATIFAMAVAAVHLRGHTLQILTKRAARLATLLRDPQFWDQVNAEASAHVMEGTDPHNRRSNDARATLDDYGPDHPPPGIWLGVSVENQAAADERIPHLLATPAAVRFLSCEPLLGPLNLRHIDLPGGHDEALPLGAAWLERLEPGEVDGPRIDWVIAGGESGSKARPIHPDWARDLRDQCQAAGVPFFFKQWGDWKPICEMSEAETEALYVPVPEGKPDDSPRQCRVRTTGVRYDGFTDLFDAFRVIDGHGGMLVFQVGKRRAGALLDGREWREMPHA